MLSLIHILKIKETEVEIADRLDKIPDTLKACLLYTSRCV